MNLENQVVSLELAKKMKELGFRQESIFYWIKSVFVNGKEEWELWNDWQIEYEGEDFGTLDEQQDYCFAYTVAELGEMLPSGYMSFHTKLNDWFCEDLNTFIQPDYRGNCWGTEADARAKMLIYLKENNLI